MKVYLHTLLTALRPRVERSGPATFPGKEPRIHQIQGCVGPKAGPSAMPNRKTSYPCRESNCDFWVVQPNHYTDFATPAHET
jgi:hypothetical protein